MTDDPIWYHSTPGQEPHGPLSWDQIEADYRSGALDPDVLLWAPHLQDWTPARSLIKPAAAPPPLPPAPPLQALDANSGPRPSWPAPATPVASPGLPGSHLDEAPGARAGRILGIWALISGLLCFPVGIVLAILAMVKTNEAFRHAAQSPGRYQQPSRAGTVMGIIALVIPGCLFVLGIMSAIAIPALLGQRSRARDHVAIANLQAGLAGLVGQWDKGKEASEPPEAIKAELEDYLRQAHGNDRDPWNPALPAFSYTIAVTPGGDQARSKETAKDLATQLGQCVYVISFPSGQQPGYIAGAVHTSQFVNGTKVLVQSTPID
jgi:type II secretory pathway pseudopilin PulG